MTAAEQQVLFQQTRARIQQNLNEVAELAQNSFDGKIFFPRFIRLLTDSLSAEGGALWIPSAQGFEQIAAVNFASNRFETDPAQRQHVEATLTRISQNPQPLIIAAAPTVFSTQASAPADLKNQTPYPYFYTPVSLNERLVLVVQIWLKETGDPASYQEIAAFIQTWASYAVIFLRNHQGAIAASKNEEFAHLLRMQSALLGELNPKEVASVMVNYTADLTRADLVCLFRQKGTAWRLIAASNQEKIDDKSQQSRKLMNLAAQLPVGEKSQRHSVGGESLPEVSEQLTELDYAHVIWTRIQTPHAHTTHLLCGLKHVEQPFPANAGDLLDRVTESSGVALDTAHHYQHLPFRPVLASASRLINDWHARRRNRVFLYVALLVLIGVVLALIPVPLKISAECQIEPKVVAAAVAEAPGKIREVYVAESQTVKKGDLLARLEDEDYTTQIAVAEQEKMRWQVESARAQNTSNEAERKLAEINVQRQIETINRLKYLRSKTEVRAPIDGVILTKNLQNREGETMETGKVFCELSAMKDYRVVLLIKQADIGDLLRAWRANSELPVDFILHSNAQYTLKTHLTPHSLIGQVPEMRKDHGYYLVSLPMPPDSPIDSLLKPGYTGKAKIRIGESSLLYNWFRPFLNYWRVEWGV